MNTKLNCPVCGYQEIEGDTCPNCDTDLSLIRSLQQLPPTENPWTKGFAILMLMIGIMVGVAGSFFILQTQFYIATIPNPVVTANPTLPPNVPIKPPTQPEIRTYSIQKGDTISSIADKFCAKGTPWNVIIEANPQLIGRENKIALDEVIKIPLSCKEKLE
ncbi:LysM peptidoglycan-binding domain-containing protein [Cronbergia sp. UHCC 0137]|uniref:LysM peptidoglycan-binding domain-containing protein n=1 Tax=Cronbergia sp. UHCC 0137 TaxID=3110239 RepID=UPI002B1F4234|nr:LysM peptidoglycan-binding domain-containing protein [Cronbergia sp. UHCC 0137]MEA5619818.1 LysM peptidoglycan-binding domain-containing protein [Cronbergia sp. UHCC 0137]